MTNSFITSDKDAKNLTESLQVQEKDGIQSISARELYKGLQISDRFSRWFESLLKYGFVENEDFTSVKSSTLVNLKGNYRTTQFLLIWLNKWLKKEGK